MSDKEGYEGWAVLELMGYRLLVGRLTEATIAGAAFIRIDVLELMGYRRLVGRLTEATIAGAAFIRIDVPDSEGGEVTQFYAPSAVYAITPTTEDSARRAAKTNSVQPIQAWELREIPSASRVVPAYPDDEDDDEDEEPRDFVLEQHARLAHKNDDELPDHLA